MRDITTIFLLALAPSLSLAPGRAAAQEPAGPKPVQPARPLTLPTLRPPVADTGIFSPVPLPPPSDTRRADGAPGQAYWQQRVDYTIRATLDTAAKRLSGTETIRYTNHSPDTLRFVWMQLDQNLFRQGSTGSLLFASESRFGAAGFQGGFDIGSVSQCGSAGQQGGGAVPTKRKARAKPKSARDPLAVLPPCPAAPLKTRVDDTMMYVDLATPIPPG
ncbi:MAG TPA: hypothetical protein VGQ24_06550, partial [Gemmatimonadales bacterium]|nr:hypothetical protein [Gemmatimonadales bacterium]